MGLSLQPDQLQQVIEKEFQCARCGHCCKGDGLVEIGPPEADRMAGLLGLTRRKFLRNFALRIKANHWMLRDKMVNGPNPNADREQWCIFLERGPDGLYGCRVNEAKPDQCREFPVGWRNPDSLRTCAGLRAMMARLRRRETSSSSVRDPKAR